MDISAETEERGTRSHWNHRVFRDVDGSLSIREAYYRGSDVPYAWTQAPTGIVSDTIDGCELIASYTEVESGRKSDRPELRKAIAHAKRAKATLVIAKLDRLSRNVAFIANLMESGVDFVACDMPQANRFTVHIMAAVAEQEARAISQRTKDALAAAKARGVRLGTNNLTREGTLRGVKAAARAKNEKKSEAYADLVPELRAMRNEGLSLRAIADRLNSEVHTTRRGCPWNPVQVERVLAL